MGILLLISTAWSLVEVTSFGTTINDVLENNYKSISAAKSMKESLEREDSALLLLLLQNDQRGMKILNAADSMFADNFEIAKSNITITGEEELINSIETKYSEYKKIWAYVTKNGIGNKLDWYFQNSHQLFLDLMLSIDNLTSLNDKQLYSTAVEVSDRSRRAFMPGVIALIAMIIFTVLFNYFIHLYIVTPIVEITKRARKFIDHRTQFEYHVDTDDEISKLTDTITILCSHIQADESN